MRWKYRRSLEALIACVAAYLLAYRIAQPEVNLSGVPGTLALGLVVVLPLVAITLAILALRAIRAARVDTTHMAERGSYLPASVALILALAFLGTFGFYALASLRQPTRGWVAFASTSGDFTVSFPMPPTENTQTVERDGAPLTAHMVAVATGPNRGYWVSYADASGATINLDGLEADFLGRSKGVLQSRVNIRAGSVVGRELRVISPELAYRARLFVTSQRTYQVIALRPVSSNEDARDGLFLNSFTLRGQP